MSVEWSEVEPVLQATYQLLNDREEISQEEACAAVRRPPGDEKTIRALALLYEDGLIGGFTIEQSDAPISITATPKGLRQTSGWPTGDDRGAQQLEALLRVLDERIDSEETSDDDKGRLRRVRESVGDLGRDLAVGVLTAYVARITGAGGDGG